MALNKLVVSNNSQLISAFTGLSSTPTTYISIELNGGPSTPLQMTTPLTIPATFAGNISNSLIIDGNGVTLKAPSSGFGSPNVPMVKRNNGTSVDNKAISLVFKNIIFDGANLSNDVYGLEIFNSTNVIVENCKFVNCKIGLNMANVDRAAISDCTAYNISSVGYVSGIDSGVISTGCNDITYTNCKFWSVDPNCKATAFKSEATSGLSYYECSVQGIVNKGISFDSMGGNATLGNPNTINNLQIRNFKTSGANLSIIYLYLLDGFVKIDGLYLAGNVPGSGFVIDAQAYTPAPSVTDTFLPHLYVENVPYLRSTSVFNTTGGVPASNACNVSAPDPTVVWEFKEVYDSQNIFSPGRWYNSLIPYYRYAEFFNESKKILTNSISINNKYI